MTNKKAYSIQFLCLLNIFIICVKITQEVHSLSQNLQRDPAQATCTDLTQVTDQAPIVNYRNGNISPSSHISGGWPQVTLSRIDHKSRQFDGVMLGVSLTSAPDLVTDQTRTFSLQKSTLLARPTFVHVLFAFSAFWALKESPPLLLPLVLTHSFHSQDCQSAPCPPLLRILSRFHIT